MDGSNLEHSDSDSGESWTLLESSPSYADEVPDVAGNLPHPGETALTIEKDEDTDGISIISDSDHESPAPCDLKFDRCILDDDPPAEHRTPGFVSKTHPPNSSNHESMKGDADFLGDSKYKLRTYVHRRNQRLSTVLNIIVLGSVITAAGVAIGHMWGARHDCSMQMTPSVNKILSNLYKLQEENAYLRSKLKELAFLNNQHVQHKKLDSEKIKLHRCKKVFEESLNNRNAEKLTKCVDNEISADKMLESHLVEPLFEKEYLNDLDNLKNVYLRNKSWLDVEIAKRLKHENNSAKKTKLRVKPSNPNDAQEKEQFDKPLESNTTFELPMLSDNVESENGIDSNNNPPAKIVTYADSLKSVSKSKQKDHGAGDIENTYKVHIRKKRHLKEREVFDDSASEEDVKKDDRYTSHRYKIERKKNDRHKSHKKQKRKNKYEQWEMKGGYLKDYDELTMASSQDNISKLKSSSFEMIQDGKRTRYHTKEVETDGENDKNKTKKVDKVHERKSKHSNHTSKRGSEKHSEKNKELNWYEKRALLRMDARKKLEKELFEDGSPNTAGWYFRRMQRREQCRVKGDNSTYRKFSKRVMNYKTKT